MACGCSDGVCGCDLSTSQTVSITGSGQSGDPWFASVIPAPLGGLQNTALGVQILLDPNACNILTLSAAGLLGLVHVQSSASVTFSGCGTVADPITAEVIVGGGGGGVSSILPGMITMTGGSTPDANHVFCDGATYDAVADPTFLPMYNRIGTLWGGTGPADFKVPPLNARSPMGPGVDSTGAGLTNRAAGTLLGTETHSLTEAQLAGHDHDISHEHTVPAQVGLTTALGGLDAGMGTVAGADPGTDYTLCTASDGGIGVQNVEAGSHTHPFSVPANATTGGPTNSGIAGNGGVAGDGDAHPNIHPVTVLHFQISK